jgi:hypothetical protein
MIIQTLYCGFGGGAQRAEGVQTCLACGYKRIEMQSNAKMVNACWNEVPARRVDFDVVESRLHASAGSTIPVC